MHTTTRAAREAASAAYLASSPEPDPLASQCSTCKARPGKACHNQGKQTATHQARTTRAAREDGRRRKESDLAGRAAGLIHAALSHGEPTNRIVDMVAKQHPLAAAAYLASQGWKPSSREAQSPWIAPDRSTHSPADALRAAIEAAARP